MTIKRLIRLLLVFPTIFTLASCGSDEKGDSFVEGKKSIPVIARPDVLVVGGGPAGIGAAIAAARSGAKTMLVEQYGYVGGNLTVAQINPMFTFHTVKGEQVVNGIAGEFVSRMMEAGYSDGHMTDLTFDNASMTPLNPEGSKVILMDMLVEAGVDLLFHTMCVDAVARNGVVKAVIVENKSGRGAICPKVVIDCTGDGDVAVKSGAGYTLGDENGVMQPVSLFFRIGGVDTKALRKWMKTHKDLLKDSPTDEEIDSQKGIAFLGLNQLVKDEIAKGNLDEEIANRILMYELPHGQFAMNVTRLQHISGVNAADMTAAEIRLRHQVIQVHEFMSKYVGGFEGSYILDTGAQTGVRETRHIKGDYELNENDVLEGRAFEDGVSCGTYAIDIHPGQGKMQIYTGSGKAVYEIPYRSLIPVGLDNLLVAGRCLSANSMAAGSARVMATCMAMGQGAGVAAAMAAARDSKTRNVDIKELRSSLISQGQYLLNAGLTPITDPGLILDRKDSDGSRASHYNPFSKNYNP
ncbi:MAG: FAD-dependent oxidoreductase, partial [Bacteroidales bacterium]|nr:FAD-dependent oxidoreductase [Bacteroidales bacterium]